MRGEQGYDMHGLHLVAILRKNSQHTAYVHNEEGRGLGPFLKRMEFYMWTFMIWIA
jgi:hypothetical protein